MSFDIVWTESFRWHERLRGYLRLLRARKNYGMRIRIGNPFNGKELFSRVPGYQERLRSLKNIHKDRRCFIIGNGPSLKKMDLLPLRYEITIASNGFYKLFPKLGFTSTYLTMEDIAQVEDRRRELAGIKGPVKIYALHNAYCVPADEDTIFMNVHLKQDGSQKFSEDCSEIVWLGSTITFINLQLAFHFGCNPVYLIGVDFDYGPIERHVPPGKIVVTEDVMKKISQCHFDSSYHRPGNRFGIPHVDKQHVSFMKAREVYEEHGREIYNAGIDSRLDVFDRISYAELFYDEDPHGNNDDDAPVSTNDEILALIQPRGTGEKWKRLYDSAVYMYERGKINRAWKLLTRSLDTKKTTTAMYLMGCIKKSSGDYDGATGIFRKLLDAKGPRPNSQIYAGAHYHLGEMNYRQKNLLEAQYHLEQCLNIVPGHSRAYEYLQRIRVECETESLMGVGTEILTS